MSSRPSDISTARADSRRHPDPAAIANEGPAQRFLRKIMAPPRAGIKEEEGAVPI
jgi:hypothetical protein